MLTLTRRMNALSAIFSGLMDAYIAATPRLWVIELHNGVHNVLALTFINDAIRPALDAVEGEWRKSLEAAKAKGKSAAPDEGKGALIIIGKRDQNKFFSNGEASLSTVSGVPLKNETQGSTLRMLSVTLCRSSLVSQLSPWHAAVLKDQSAGGYNLMMKQLLTFPSTVLYPKLEGQKHGNTYPLLVSELVPTVAAINGHCFAGGMMLALCCDYRVMTDGGKRNAWMCMNEVRGPPTLPPSGPYRYPKRSSGAQIHLGSSWPLSFVTTLRVKVADANLHRKIALEGHRFTPKEALEVGLVDQIVPGDSAEAVLHKARGLAESLDSLAKGGAWGLIKVENILR